MDQLHSWVNIEDSEFSYLRILEMNLGKPDLKLINIVIEMSLTFQRWLQFRS